MIQLSAPNISKHERAGIKACLDSGWVSSAGKLVNKFEEAVCRYVKARHAVACINGTSGLFIALKLAGVEPGDEVVVPALTFIAPVNVVRYLGAEPVFMDCGDFMNLDPVKLREFCGQKCRLTPRGLVNRKTGRTIKAVIPVHIFGNPCRMAGIMDVARTYRLRVIEDATESLGSYFTGGAHKDKFTGTIGDMGVYSFNGNKIITAGSGGMIVTDKKKFAEKARYLVNQAKDDPLRSIHDEVGYNFRLTNLQSALGLAQLDRIEDFIKVKERNFKLYVKGLAGTPGLKMLGIPDGTRPNFWMYSLIVEKGGFGKDNEKLMQSLSEKKIETRPVWRLNHLQKPYRSNQAYRIERAAWFYKRVLNLPSGSALKPAEVKSVIAAIRKARG